jgi:hypothetical protein
MNRRLTISDASSSVPLAPLGQDRVKGEEMSHHTVIGLTDAELNSIVPPCKEDESHYDR